MMRRMQMNRIIPTTSAEFDHTRIIERPDGFYWQDETDSREYGPFATLTEAVDDMQGFNADGVDEIEAADFRDAGDVLGVSDWIDPDTGELAEDERTRTDEH